MASEDGKDKINGNLVSLPDVTQKLAIKLDMNETTVCLAWKQACPAYYADKEKCYKSQSYKKFWSQAKIQSCRPKLLRKSNVFFLPREEPFVILRGCLGSQNSQFIGCIARDKRLPDVIFPCANTIKPMLTEENYMTKLLYAVNHLQLNHVDQVLVQQQSNGSR